LSIDRINPLSSEPTDLSLFASWGSLNWASVKFSEGYRSTHLNIEKGIQTRSSHPVVRALCFRMIHFLYGMGGFFSHHFYTSFVEDKNRLQFLNSLDQAYLKNKKSISASWFNAQHLTLDFSGF